MKIITISGKQIDPLDPKPEDIVLHDIFYSFARIVRFGGHTTRHWTVGQHSILVAKLLQDGGQPKPIIAAGLLHDAAEAYIGDMITPVKRLCQSYKDVEEGFLQAIGYKYGLGLAKMPEAVKDADKEAFDIETNLLTGGNLPAFGDRIGPDLFAMDGPTDIEMALHVASQTLNISDNQGGTR